MSDYRCGAKCTSCGANLSAGGTKDAAICPYCGASSAPVLPGSVAQIGAGAFRGCKKPSRIYKEWKEGGCRPFCSRAATGYGLFLNKLKCVGPGPGLRGCAALLAG